MEQSVWSRAFRRYGKLSSMHLAPRQNLKLHATKLP